MTADPGSNKDSAPRGFAGLSSLASDVAVPDPIPQPAKESSPAPSRTQSESEAHHKPRNDAASGYQIPPQTGASGGSAKWLWGIGIAIAVIWAIAQSDNKPRPQPPVAIQGLATQTTPAPTVEAKEAKPPVGSTNVLSAAQIQYCLAEDIRLDAAKAAVDRPS